MPEKQAKGFGEAEKDQVFEVNKAQQAAAQPKEKQLILNIAQASGTDKILIKERVATIKYTGNPIVDAYTRLNEFIIDHSKIKVKEKAVFFRLLAVMLNAGLPLIKSLRTLGVQSEKNPRLSKILYALAGSIEGGKSFSEAMLGYPDVFGDAEVGMVKSGEASGQLNKTLKAIASEQEKNASITGKVKGAMIYPIVILSLLVAAMTLIVMMVVPQLETLFSQAGSDLPLPTKILVTMSDIANNYFVFVLIGMVLFGMAFSWWRKTRTGRLYIDTVKINLPVFGDIFRKLTLSKFSRGFANMMGSGVPIIKSIEIVSHAIGNEVYKRRLVLTAEDMRRGIPMAENMSESKLFPKMLVNMIEVGEQTAQLENVMLKVAEFYDEEVDNVVSALTKIMEPMILIVIGLGVGFLVAAIMLPIMSLTDIAGSGAF